MPSSCPKIITANLRLSGSIVNYIETTFIRHFYEFPESFMINQAAKVTMAKQWDSHPRGSFLHAIGATAFYAERMAYQHRQKCSVAPLAAG